MILTLMPAMSFAADAELPSADDLSVCYTPSSDSKGGGLHPHIMQNDDEKICGRAWFDDVDNNNE